MRVDVLMSRWMDHACVCASGWMDGWIMHVDAPLDGWMDHACVCASAWMDGSCMFICRCRCGLGMYVYVHGCHIMVTASLSRRAPANLVLTMGVIELRIIN
jgi:hypothetical protein